MMEPALPVQSSESTRASRIVCETHAKFACLVPFNSFNSLSSTASPTSTTNSGSRSSKLTIKGSIHGSS